MPMLKVGATSMSASFCASLAMISGHSQSVPSRPVGPCCSLEPIGMTMVLERLRKSSISAQVDRCNSIGGSELGGLAEAEAVDRRHLGGVERAGGFGVQALPQLGAVLDAQHQGVDALDAERIAVRHHRRVLAPALAQRPERRGAVVVAAIGVVG